MERPIDPKILRDIAEKEDIREKEAKSESQFFGGAPLDATDGQKGLKWWSRATNELKADTINSSLVREASGFIDEDKASGLDIKKAV